MTNPRVGWLLAIALLLTVAPAAAQPGDDLKALRQEIETLKQGQSAIQKDLQDIKELLRSRPSAPLARPPAPPQDLALDLAGAPVKGAAAAKITMVEYTDYQ